MTAEHFGPRYQFLAHLLLCNWSSAIHREAFFFGMGDPRGAEACGDVGQSFVRKNNASLSISSTVGRTGLKQ